MHSVHGTQIRTLAIMRLVHKKIMHKEESGAESRRGGEGVCLRENQDRHRNSLQAVGHGPPAARIETAPPAQTQRRNSTTRRFIDSGRAGYAGQTPSGFNWIGGVQVYFNFSMGRI